MTIILNMIYKFFMVISWIYQYEWGPVNHWDTVYTPVWLLAGTLRLYLQYFVLFW